MVDRLGSLIHVEIPRKVNPKWKRPFYIEKAELKGSDATMENIQQFSLAGDEPATAEEACPEDEVDATATMVDNPAAT